MSPADAFGCEGKIDGSIPAVDPPGQGGVFRIIDKDRLAGFFRFSVDPQGIFQETLFIDPGGKIKPDPGSVLGQPGAAGPVSGGFAGIKAVGPVKNGKGMAGVKIKGFPVEANTPLCRQARRLGGKGGPPLFHGHMKMHGQKAVFRVRDFNIGLEGPARQIKIGLDGLSALGPVMGQAEPPPETLIGSDPMVGIPVKGNLAQGEKDRGVFDHAGGFPVKAEGKGASHIPQMDNGAPEDDVRVDDPQIAPAFFPEPVRAEKRRVQL